MPKLKSISDHTHHEHILLQKADLAPFKCDGCQQFGYNIGYSCSEKCDFQLHPPCTEKFGTYIRLRQFKCNFLHLREPPEKPTTCAICDDAINGYVYSCADEGCTTRLHPSCAALPNVLKVRDDGMLLDLKKTINKRCYMCRERELGGTRTWSYVVRSKPNIQFHITCIREMMVRYWDRVHHLGSPEEDDGSMTPARTVEKTRTQRFSVVSIFGAMLGLGESEADLNMRSFLDSLAS
jgi:C1 domain